MGEKEPREKGRRDLMKEGQRRGRTVRRTRTRGNREEGDNDIVLLEDRNILDGPNLRSFLNMKSTFEETDQLVPRS